MLTRGQYHSPPPPSHTPLYPSRGGGEVLFSHICLPGVKRSRGHTHIPTENNTPDTDTHTHDKNNTPNPQTNTSHKHLTTLEGGATTVRATSQIG